MARIRGFEELVKTVIEELRLTQPDLDTKPGSITRDILDVFMARLAETYTQISTTSRLQSIFAVSGEDLNNLASNFNLTRRSATTATGTALLTTNSLEADIPIAIGDSVTSVNGVVFEVTSNFLMRSANKNVYSATVSRFRSDLDIAGINDTYGIEVTVEASTTGTNGNISQYTLRRTDITGIDNVTNVETFSGGTDIESDEEFRRRIVLSLAGNNVGTKDGLESLMLSNSNVIDVYVAVSGDPLLSRDGTIAGVDNTGEAIVITEGTGGKVDIYIYGSSDESYIDSFIYTDIVGGGPTDSGNDRILGTGGQTSFSTSLNRRRLDALETGGTPPKQPVDSILSVSGSESGGGFIQEYTDSNGETQGNYRLAKDTSIGQGGSVFGADKLHFIASEIEIEDEIQSKGPVNGQDSLVYADVTSIPEVTQNIFVVNESSTVESSRNIIKTLHTPISTVSKVFNATTGERYIITDQNVDGSGTLNTTGRIQISGSTLPAASDILQVNYTWVKEYDSNIDYDSLTSLLSVNIYENLVQDSVDWGFGNIVIEDNATIVIVGSLKKVTATYNISRVISVTSDGEEIYDVVDNTGAGFTNNVITLPTNTTATGTVIIQYVANITNLIPQTALTTLPITKSGNGYDVVTGYQPITIADNVLTSTIQYSGEILPEDNLNPWSLAGIPNVTAPTISNDTVGSRDVLVFANADTGAYYYRSETILESTSNVDYSVSMRIVDATIGNSWNSDVGFYIDDGTYNMRFVFFTDSSGNRMIGLRNSLASPIYSATTAVNWTTWHTYRIVKTGTTDVRLYIDGTLAITALYNVANFITTVNSGTVSFGYFEDESPARSEWEFANYSITTTSDVESPRRYAPTQLKCTIANAPSSGVLGIGGVTIHKVESQKVATEDFDLTIDLSNWTSLTSTQLANSNYKLAKVESIQKIASDGSVSVDYQLVDDIDDLERRYNFNVLPNAETYPWIQKFEESDQVEVSIDSGTLLMETDATSATGPSVYYRTEDQFDVGRTITAVARMKIDSYTEETLAGTINDVGVGIIIQDANITVPLRFVAVGTDYYIAVEKDTSQFSDPTDAYILYSCDWRSYHEYTFTVTQGGNVSVEIDTGAAITIPYSTEFSSTRLWSINSEAVIFGHTDNRVTETTWDYFRYVSADAEESKYFLKDNFYDLHLAEEDTSLDSFELRLVDSSANSTGISIGNTIKTIFYYVVENDSESLNFTTNGTLYTANTFALIDDIFISSGFANAVGTVSGTLMIDSINQPALGSTYNVDYNFTAPKEGERITVNYTYNELLGDLTETLEDFRVVTSDILIKEAEEIDIDVTVDVVPETGYNLALNTLQQNIQTSISGLLTAEELGTTIDSSDVIAVIYNNTGVDKVTLITFNLADSAGVRSTITAEGNEYLAPGTITVNLKDRSGNLLL